MVTLIFSRLSDAVALQTQGLLYIFCLFNQPNQQRPCNSCRAELVDDCSGRPPLSWPSPSTVLYALIRVASIRPERPTDIFDLIFLFFSYCSPAALDNAFVLVLSTLLQPVQPSQGRQDFSSSFQSHCSVYIHSIYIYVSSPLHPLSVHREASRAPRESPRFFLAALSASPCPTRSFFPTACLTDSLGPHHAAHRT